MQRPSSFPAGLLDSVDKIAQADDVAVLLTPVAQSVTEVVHGGGQIKLKINREGFVQGRRGVECRARPEAAAAEHGQNSPAGRSDTEAFPVLKKPWQVTVVKVNGLIGAVHLLELERQHVSVLLLQIGNLPLVEIHDEGDLVVLRKMDVGMIPSFQPARHGTPDSRVALPLPAMQHRSQTRIIDTHLVRVIEPGKHLLRAVEDDQDIFWQGIFVPPREHPFHLGGTLVRQQHVKNAAHGENQVKEVL